jgi:Protein of unknown function (DUF3455)
MPRARVAVVATLALISGAACSRDAPAPTPLHAPDVPAVLSAPAGETVIARAAAEGSQIYECQAGEEAGLSWRLSAPDAVLTDSSGARMGRHYAGPTWEALDGSKVVGALRQKVDAPSGGGVPWLLLSAKSTEGTGTFAHVTSIQRVDTVGGLPPGSGCDASHTGTRQSVPYRATYYFYGR